MGAKPTTIKAEVCGAEGWWGEREEGVSSRGNSLDFVSIGCKKMLLSAPNGSWKDRWEKSSPVEESGVSPRK